MLSPRRADAGGTGPRIAVRRAGGKLTAAGRGRRGWRRVIGTVVPVAAMCTVLGVAACRADQPSPADAAVRHPIAWRMLSSPGPHAGADNEAISQTADLETSDPGFIGMMVRCRNAALETILVVAEPLPPRATADVTLSGGGATVVAPATPIITGAGLQVPIDLVAQLNGAWAGEPALDVTIATPDRIHGVVSLQGLRTPLLQLSRDCGMAAPKM